LQEEGEKKRNFNFLHGGRQKSAYSGECSITLSLFFLWGGGGNKKKRRKEHLGAACIDQPPKRGRKMVCDKEAQWRGLTPPRISSPCIQIRDKRKNREI